MSTQIPGSTLHIGPPSAHLQVLWNHAGRIIDYGSLYGISLLLARTFGVKEYGAYVGVLSLINLGVTISSIGLEQAVLHFIPPLIGRPESGGIRSFLRLAAGARGLVVIVCSLVLALVPAIAGAFTDALSPSLRNAFTVVLLSRAFLPLLSAFAAALGRVKAWTITTAVVRLCEIAGVAWLFRQQTALEEVFWFFSCTTAVYAFTLLFSMKMPAGGVVAAGGKKKFLRFAVAFWPNSILDFALGRYGDIFFLGIILHDAAVVSYYDVSYSLMQFASMVLTLGFGGITLAVFSRKNAVSPESADRSYERLVRVMNLLQIPMYALLLGMGDLLIPLIYSSRYAGASQVLSIMVLFRIGARITGGGENADFLLATGKPGTLVRMSFVAASVNVLLDLILIPLFGIYGAVVGSGCGTVVAAALSFLAIRRTRAVRLQIRSWSVMAATLLIAGLIRYGAYAIAGNAPLVLLALFWFVGTFAVLIALKPLEQGDIPVSSKWGSAVNSVARHFTRPGTAP